jgi:hypothetical protein
MDEVRHNEFESGKEFQKEDDRTRQDSDREWSFLRTSEKRKEVITHPLE